MSDATLAAPPSAATTPTGVAALPPFSVAQ